MNIQSLSRGFFTLMINNHYVYILECRDGTYYTGYTTDVERRLKQHLEGKGAKYTRGRSPVQLVYQQSFCTKTEAMQEEYRIKQLKRQEKQHLILSKGKEVMWRQQSYQGSERSGRLYLVPTPIGNLEDMTFRAIRILKEADRIAAEDTRQTKKLLNHFEIETQLVSYHEHNKQTSGAKLLSLLREGKTIALVSDAGMPGISDPGYDLVKACVEEEIAVIPLPGANAALPSLVASGIPTDHFYFFGFLSRDKKRKKTQLKDIRSFKAPLIFYEAPHRIKDTLKIMEEVLGNRNAAVVRELTKKYEEIIRGDLSNIRSWSESDEVRGEFCLVVEGNTEEPTKEQEWWEELTVEEHVNYYVSVKKLKSKEAIKQTASDRKLPKREVYQAYHIK
jgi:16S rRNA (cytidine1402-2'-O)-methyltransferase